MKQFQFKKSYLLYLLIIMIVIFMTWVFMTPAVTDTCSDNLLGCLDKAHDLSFSSKIQGAFVCLYGNVICVFGNIPYLF